jgi:hypothetical protein
MQRDDLTILVDLNRVWLYIKWLLKTSIFSPPRFAKWGVLATPESQRQARSIWRLREMRVQLRNHFRLHQHHHHFGEVSRMTVRARRKDRRRKRRHHQHPVHRSHLHYDNREGHRHDMRDYHLHRQPSRGWATVTSVTWPKQIWSVCFKEATNHDLELLQDPKITKTPYNGGLPWP